MADSEHSTSDDASVDSRAEDTSQDSKLVFSEDEETLIIRMYNLVGERWALIAGRIPGRTADEIEKYWNSRYSPVNDGIQETKPSFKKILNGFSQQSMWLEYWRC